MLTTRLSRPPHNDPNHTIVGYQFVYIGTSRLDSLKRMQRNYFLPEILGIKARPHFIDERLVSINKISSQSKLKNH